MHAAAAGSPEAAAVARLPAGSYEKWQLLKVAATTACSSQPAAHTYTYYTQRNKPLPCLLLPPAHSVFTAADYQKAMQMAAAGQSDRQLKFGRSNGHW